MFSAVENILAS